ncbi:MAG: DUF2784 domain-containing protein [Pseudomonadota bacterium]
MTPGLAALGADALLVAHVGVVLFVVGVAVLVPLGAARGWRWVRHRQLRLLHLAAITFIAAQAWLGELCPLTEWEQGLRGLAGEAAHAESVIGYWLGRLLYIDAPWWAFVAVYTAFAAFVAALWKRVPPARGRRRDPAP